MSTNREPTCQLEGARSILAALEADSRPVHALLMSTGSARRQAADVRARVGKFARARDIRVQHMSAEQLDARVDGRTHGGLVALCGPRRYCSLSQLLAGQQRPFLALLEGVEDPYNYGQALRSLYAAGAHGVIVGRRDWSSAAGIVGRASAGASERLRMARVEHPQQALDSCRRRGLTIACSSAEVSDHERPSRSCYAADLTRPVLLVVGGEKRGIGGSLHARGDWLLRIPTAAAGVSLGTAAATAVLAFEVRRQRHARDGAGHAPQRGSGPAP